MSVFLLDRSPFLPDPSEVAFRGERIRVRAEQIILWATLTVPHITTPNPSAVPFPVILDTGHNHSFAIQERHLIEWVGIRPESLAVRSFVRDREQRVPLRQANIWIHPNVNGSRDRLLETKPLELDAQKGIAVYPADFPRLPLLGLRAIAENRLVLKVDGPKRFATLRTTFKLWPFC